MFTLNIDTDNDAFVEDPAAEVARLLRTVANRLEGKEIDGRLLDINGNTVGTFDLTLTDDWNGDDK